jgi:hypothetical protein
MPIEDLRRVLRAAQGRFLNLARGHFNER